MFRKLALFAAILALVVIVMGAYVRLSDAGLGCPDWPGCYGKALLSDSAEFQASAKSAFPNSPLDMAKAWKEMTHRYLAGALGITALVLFVMAWGQKQQRFSAIGWTSALLILIGSQAALGRRNFAFIVGPDYILDYQLDLFADKPECQCTQR